MWKRLPNLPFNIVNHQTIVLDNSVYIIGGYKNSESPNYQKITVFVLSKNNVCAQLTSCLTFCWKCDKVYNSIVLLHNSIEPVDRYGHTVVKWRQVGILFGGCRTNDQFGYSSPNIYLFVPNNRCLPSQLKVEANYCEQHFWLVVNGIGGTGPSQRDGHSSVVWHDNMFLFGGLLGLETKYFDNKLYQLDLICWQWTIVDNRDSVEPLGRDFSCLLVHRNDLYLFGGRSDDSVREVTYNDIYDTAVWKYEIGINRNNRWTKIHPGHGVICNTTWSTNPNDNVVNQSYTYKYTKCPFPRRSHMAVVFQNEIVIFGGLYETHSFSVHLNDLWSFDISTCQWTLVTENNLSRFKIEKPTPLRRSSLTLINDNYALLVGGVTASDSNSDNVDGKMIGHSLTIPPELKWNRYSNSVTNLCTSNAIIENPIVLHQKPHTTFSGSITMINDLSLHSVNHVFLLQPQRSLYQRALFVVVNSYSLSQLEHHLVPHNVISDIERVLIFER